MPPVSYAAKSYVIPDKGSPASVVKAFMDGFFNVESPGRREWISEMYLSKLMVESQQWLEAAATSRPGYAPRWTNQPGEAQENIPKPITNEILKIVDGEVGRLRNRKSKPKVRSRQAGADGSKVGAKRGEDILESYLDSINWPRERRSAAYRNVVFGLGIFKSFLEQNWLDTVKVGKSDCYRCVNDQCGSIVASQKIKPEAFLGLPPEKAQYVKRQEAFDPVKSEMSASYSVENCLDCGAPTTKDTASMDEAQQTDIFGESLGVDVPKNTPMLESVSPFELFFENEGIGVTPQKINIIGQQTPRDLDWVASHYNLQCRDGRYFKVDANGEQELVAEQAEVIAECMTILGEVAHGSQGAASANNRNLYRNHVRVREIYSQPTIRHKMGRVIHMAGNLCLLDTDLMVPSQSQPGTVIPRVKYAFARFYEKEGQLQGQGIVVPLISPQRRINMTFSQIIANRERNGNHGIIATRGMRLNSPGWMRGIPGFVAFYDPDPEQPDKEPKPFPAQLMDASVYKEVEYTTDRMGQIVGTQDVDQGFTSPGAPATAIKLLQDKSSERRQQRIEEFSDAEKEAWSHLLLLIREYVREPRPYKFISKSTGQWEDDEFQGADLAGQTDIVVEEQSSFDDEAYERENVTQALQMGVIAPQTPFSRYSIGKALGLKADIMEEQNVQVEDALRKWYAFKEQQTVPSVDQYEDDHNTFWNVYGKEFKSETGLQFKTECGWDELLKVIAGWQDKLVQAEMVDQQVKQIKSAMQTGQMAPMVPGIEQALQQPPLPAAMEDKIMFTWTQMVQAKQQTVAQAAVTLGVQQGGMVPPPPPPFDLQHPFVKMKAVAEAHRIYDERKTMAAQASPTMAAPGAQATQAGTEPTGAAPVGVM